MEMKNLWVVCEGSPSLSKAGDNIDDPGGKADLEGESSQGKGSQGGLYNAQCVHSGLSVPSD